MNGIPRHNLAPPLQLDLCDLRLEARFDNSFVRELPADPLQHDFPRPIRNARFNRVKPRAELSPESLAWADALAGNRVLPGM